MGAERGLRQRIRAAIRAEYPNVLIVGQPANGMTGPGRHDLYVVVRGVYVGLEVKTSTGRATIFQLDRIRDTRRAGGYAWLVRSTKAACWAVRLARTGVVVAEESDFDIDSLLASFRKDDPEQEPDDLDREIAGFKPSQALSEEHIAAAAQANGTAAGDGEAVGEAQTPMAALAQAINGLTAAVRDLRITAEQLKAARITQVATYLPVDDSTAGSQESEEESEISTADLATVLFGSADLPAAEPTPESTTPAPPSTKRVRKPRP